MLVSSQTVQFLSRFTTFAAGGGSVTGAPQVRPPSVDRFTVTVGTATLVSSLAGTLGVTASAAALMTAPHFLMSLSTRARDEEVIRLYLSRVLAESTTLHGVFLDVLEMGVLITGASAIGKSELALELISRGNGLVADDIVELYRISPDTIEGRCPAVLRDFLEVRGIGVLNIRTIFGEAALRRRRKRRCHC